MKIQTTKSFDKDYRKLPKQLKNIFDKKLRLFMHDSKHPSLRVKRIQGTADLWEGSVTMKYRFIFRMEGDLCILYRLGPHDILDNP